MNGGLIVVSCVVSALVLFETVLPRVIVALRRRRQFTALAERRKTAEGGVAVHGSGDASPAPTATVTGSPDDVRRDKRHIVAKSIATVRPGEADRLWAKARELPHNDIPDPTTDGGYLVNVYAAAKLGHLESMVTLGDYAFRRGAMVEAYYWMSLADLKGAHGLSETLAEMENEWFEAGCPDEYENVYGEFSEQQGSFARALLRYRFADGVPTSRVLARMCELADQGCEGAKLFLERMRDEG